MTIFDQAAGLPGVDPVCNGTATLGFRQTPRSEYFRVFGRAPTRLLVRGEPRRGGGGVAWGDRRP